MKIYLEPFNFESLSDFLFKNLGQREHLMLSLSAEQSQFIRVNGARIRQAGVVEDASLDLTLTVQSTDPSGIQRAGFSLSLTGNERLDRTHCLTALKTLQQEVPSLPMDPYAEIPKAVGKTSELSEGKILPTDEVHSNLLEPLQDMDVAGIYAAGPIVRAFAHSGGLSRFFKTENYSFDFSLYTPMERALKQTLAGRSWDSNHFKNVLNDSKQKLSLLEHKPHKLNRGSYRVYLAPAAAAELVNMLSMQALSEAAIRQGESPLRKSRNEGIGFSNLFSLSEDFSSGEVPRFNEYGELSPLCLPLIEKGKLVGTLVNSRTAKEYGTPSNFANLGEYLRSPVIQSGDLQEEEILNRLGGGIYLSNLHYLNWSDQSGGRITGMTRYACFWVEDGKMIAPIENMRFDDTIFNLLGSSLEAVTDFRHFIPEVHTYGNRSIGGILMPGLLISKMDFTL